MQLDAITPLILTCNEEANLRETLAGLRWAKQILIVDSGSCDETLLIASELPSVCVVHREFDHFADQCNFGLRLIKTPWVLSLDADYKCDEHFARELETLDDSLAGYEANFVYSIYGKPLRASLYPPRVVLYQTELAVYGRDGHAHRVGVDGRIGQISTPIFHDDRKSLSHWLASQGKYAVLEAEKLLGAPPSGLGWKDRLRSRIIFAPVLTFVYCLIVRGLILDGRAGFYYTMQRVFAELALSLALLDRKLRSDELAVESADLVGVVRSQSPVDRETQEDRCTE